MKTFRCSKVFVFLVILALLTAVTPLLAAETTLEVQCLDQAGNPAAGAKVIIQNLENAKLKDKKSDAKGMALFDKLDNGYYRVQGRKEGFAPALYEFALLKDGANQQVKLRFVPGDMQAKLWFEDPALNQKAYDLLNEGINSLRANKIADAEKQFTASLAIFPSLPDSLLNMGIVYIQQSKWDLAEESVKKASVAASALSSMQRPKGAAGPNFEDLNKRIEMILSKLPVEKLRTDGNKALADKRFPEAIAKYSEGIKLDPSDPDLYYNLALAQGNSKQFDEAIKSIEKAIQLKPTETSYSKLKTQIESLKENEVLSKAQALINEGQELGKKNDFVGAMKKYEAALPMVPANKQGIVWEQIAVARANADQQDQAIEAFRKAIELSPDNASYREALAQYYLRLKKYDDALNVYSDPRSGGSKPLDEALFALGKNLSAKGNTDVAQLAFERAIKANPQNAEAYYELGMSIAYSEKKDDKRAAELLNKYLELGKDTGHLDNTRSVLVIIKKRM